MKIRCPLCGNILVRFESVLIHIKRCHSEIPSEKALELAYNAKVLGGKKKYSFRKKKKKFVPNKKERDALLGIKPIYKEYDSSEKVHSIYWKSIIKSRFGNSK